MEDVNIDSVIPQPPRQPESVASGLVRDGNAPDLAPLPDCLVAPAMQELKQAIRVRTLLLPRLTLDPGDNAGDEPARLAELQTDDILPRNSCLRLSSDIHIIRSLEGGSPFYGA